VIFYDYPLNESVRLFLRLVALFRRVLYFLQRDDARDYHAALLTLFELVDGTVRSDVKSELLQGLERQRMALIALRKNPQVACEPLEATLAELELVTDNLRRTVGKFAEHLRNHEGLMAIKQRMSIPGGICDFDLPVYHYWLSLPAGNRRAQFEQWLSPLLSTHVALELHIRLLLESGKIHHLEAVGGSYQQNKVGAEARLLRVGVADNLPFVPEISANKYLLNIRFWDIDGNERSVLSTQTVPFALMFCSF
jgi:Uncharacterized protein conserved in bacteria